MIREAFQHCHGIGPARLRQLHALGIRTWEDVLQNPLQIPAPIRPSLVSECCQLVAALQREDIDFFVQRFASSDRWRILERFLHDATFFDIETTGLEFDAHITVICAWHRGTMQTFVDGRNLDEFLNLLDDTRLLVSFNGGSFDVPRVLQEFHIPQLPCPHIDLRWSCYHKGLPGSLKQIAESVGLHRPADLSDADGAMAVTLWNHWIAAKDPAAMDSLIRYCAADVLLLKEVTQFVCGHPRENDDAIWRHLPQAESISLPCTTDETPESPSSAEDQIAEMRVDNQHTKDVDRHALTAPLFGGASPARMRTRRMKRG